MAKSVRYSIGSLAVLGVGLVVPASAQGAAMYYFNDPNTSRAAFQAAAKGPLTLESFEQPVTAGVSIAFGDFTVSSSENVLLSRSDRLPSRLVSDGRYSLNFSEQTTNLTFDFAKPINYFGLDINDLNFESVSFSDNVGDSIPNVLLPDFGTDAGGPGFTNLQFFGVSNTTAFTRVVLSFGTVEPSGNVSIDRLEYGAATSGVPEPISWVTMVGGFGAIGGAVRRQKRRIALRLA